MKTISILLSLLLISSAVTLAQQSLPLDGAYLSQKDDIHLLWLFKNGYSSQITYKDDKYIGTLGGPYQFDGTSLSISLEYNDASPEKVGDILQFTTAHTTKELRIQDQVFVKQVPKFQNLDAVWRITGRRDTEKNIHTISRGDRKTIKILVDGYFQWIAINPAVKGFYGTGGGNYNFTNGEYTERITFFSRDNTRVGNVLKFKGEITNKDWHHSGMSSKGEPIYEIWSLD